MHILSLYLPKILFVFMLICLETRSLSLNKSKYQFRNFCAASIFSIFLPFSCSADMLTFPLPAPLKNNYVLARSAECFADADNVIQTNPVKKLRVDNSLTFKGKEQTKDMANNLLKMGFSPSFIWTSNTERAYETAASIARVLQLGQNRIIPEYSFLDARSTGIFEGKDIQSTWNAIHYMDEHEGINYKPPGNTDGTPSESVSDVLVFLFTRNNK